jgi:hypothetical protein
MGHLRPDERLALETALKAVDDEEARSVRLYAIGQITESVWNDLWREWQDRRNRIRTTLDSLQERQQTHVENLESALQIIANIGIMYNGLERDDQRELLREMVERVIVDPAGNVRLELQTPFSYLQDLSKQVRNCGGETSSSLENKTTSKDAGRNGLECSNQVLLSWEGRTRTYNLGLQRPLLCRLSYFPIYPIIIAEYPL